MLLIALAAAEPLDVLRAEGCLACHPGGGRGVGPALAGIVGRTETVIRDGASVTVTVDEAFLRRALTEPDAEGSVGFPPGVMPAVTDPARVDRLVAAITALSPAPAASPWWLAGVFAGGAAFTGGHLLLSGARIRASLAARFTEYGFMGIYSVPASLALGLLIYAWTRAPYVPLWDPAPWTRWVPALVMPWVMIAQVAGYSTPAPTMAGMAGKLADAPRGIHRITRHPVNISSAIWAFAHIFPNGDLASIGLFLTILVLGVAGSLHIDRRRARASPEAWARYAALTSVIPFAAILEGRNALSLREIGVWRIVSGIALYVGIVGWAHPWLIGASAWP